MAYREGQGLTDVKSPIRPERDWSGFLSLSLEGLTLVGNFFPALVAFRVKRRSERTVTDYLIGALSINDMMAVLLPLPVSLPAFIDPEGNDDWKGGKTSCVFYQFCIFWLQTAAMLLVTEMAFERYLALAIPLRYKSWRTHRRALGMICFVYSFTFVVSLMPVAGLAPPAVSKNGGRVCRSWIATQPEKWHQTIFPIFLIIQGWTTMVIVLMLNVNLVCRIRSYSKRMVGFDRNNEDERKSIREFTKLVVVIAILFYLTWLPVMIVLTLTQFGYRVPELFAVYALMSTILNGLFNPIVYCALSKQYRDGYLVIASGFVKGCCLYIHCAVFLFTTPKSNQNHKIIEDGESNTATGHVLDLPLRETRL